MAAKLFKVKLIRNVGIRGESHAAGEVVEILEDDAAMIVHAKKGYLVDADSAKPKGKGELRVSGKE